MSIDFNFCISLQALGAIFSFLVVLKIIKWGIDEGIRERREGGGNERKREA